ncbi:P-loop NTPase [Sphingomonas profundi]|uniref:P-loop NTPase n=1 Tax=Alterirhizorhabdus profundi TaxID=2681549 RepID=UPI0018D06779|nr:P-loop NTPase [Sphingomonas profundi]
MTGAERKARVLVTASGKGGVGKTAVAVNLAVALARAGRRTMLVDCDFGLADAAIMFGVNAPTTIEDVMNARVPLDAAITPTEDGVLLVPGASGSTTAADLAKPDRRRLAEGFRRHADVLDYLIVDPPAGIQPQTMRLLAMSDRILLVLTGEPTAFMNAYATVKLLALDHGCTRISVIANMVDSEVSGRDLFGRFHDVASRFLPSELDYLGSLPRDEHMRMAIMRKRPCLAAYPESRASAAVLRLAHAFETIDMPPCPGGSRFFGLEHSNGVD